jgi:four helix bundle protein
MDCHRKLRVWRHAGDVIDLVYRLTRSLPSEELFVATAQMRRAARSVQNNIAEGNARYGKREMRQFLRIAVGSLAEIDSMVAKLDDLYELDGTLVTSILLLRRKTNSALFKMIHNEGR